MLGRTDRKMDGVKYAIILTEKLQKFASNLKHRPWLTFQQDNNPKPVNEPQCNGLDQNVFMF